MNMVRELSEKGMELIKSFEGCRFTAYKCVPTEKYYTIGYGHYGADVKKGMKITQEEADELLKKDVQIFVKHVNTYMDKYNFNQNQFDALVSFAFNIGSIKQLTQNKTRTITQISNAILLYNKSGGNVLKGLVNRRKSEKELFDTPIEPTQKNYVDIALEVIDGKWGNGDKRIIALQNAGYNDKTIQAYVNAILKWCKERGYK